MTTDTLTQDPPAFTVAGALLEAIVRADFAAAAGTCIPDVAMTALVPRGFREWRGRDGVEKAFAGWYGDLSDYEVLEASIGEVGQRLHLRWRVRVRGERLGDGWFLVEQDLYADSDPSGELSTLQLMCSGYCPEPGSAR